jgi:hypothetical protein
MELDYGRPTVKCFLEKVFLRLPVFAVLFVFGLLYLFHEIAFAITMHPGLIAVFAKLSGNVIFIQLKTCVNK